MLFMNPTKAIKILKENNLTYSHANKIIVGSVKNGIDKNTQQAISCLANNNLSYYHPGHYSNYTGAKSPSIFDRYGQNSPLDIDALQQRCEKVYRDSQFAQAIIFCLRIFTVNNGLRLQASPAAKLLKISQEKLHEFTAQAENLWNTYQNSKVSDYSMSSCYAQLQAQRAFHLYLFGEYFYIRRIERIKGKYCLTSQIIDPRSITQPPREFVHKAERKGGDIMYGIETDQRMKKTAIWIKNKKIVNNRLFTRIPFYSSSGFEQLAHGFLPHENLAKVPRGLPVLSHSLHELEKVADAELFELDSMAVNASIAAFVKTASAGIQASDPLDSLGDEFNYYDSENNYRLDRISANQGIHTDRNFGTLHKNINKGGMLIQNLPPGVEIVPYDTKRPNLSFQAFIEKKMEYLAPATAGISLELVKQMFGQNFSASRASTDLSWKTFNFYNSIVAIDNQADYETFLKLKIANGEITIPYYTTDENKKALWCKTIWHGQQKPTFNPQQEATASQVMVEQGFTTRENESQKYSSASAIDNINRLKTENALLKSATPEQPQQKMQMKPEEEMPEETTPTKK